MLCWVALCLIIKYGLAFNPRTRTDEIFRHQEFIYGGEDAEEGQYPYQISLQRSKSHFCGGSILSQYWLLTAAHCVPQALGIEKITALAGTNILNKGGQRYGIEKAIIHPNYSPSEVYKNDVCLLKTKSPIKFTKLVKPITLPTQGEELQEGALLNITGWGMTNNNFSPDKLQVGKNYIFLPQEQCANLTSLKPFDGYLCTLAPKAHAGVCFGDSGSPLVKDGVQYGIASFIMRECGLDDPDYFARVANYINWIKDTLGSDAEDLKFSK